MISRDIKFWCAPYAGTWLEGVGYREREGGRFVAIISTVQSEEELLVLFDFCSMTVRVLQLEQPKAIFERPPKHFRHHAFSATFRIYIGLSPCPVTVTPKICSFWVGNPSYKLLFATGILGGGDNPNYRCIYIYIYTHPKLNVAPWKMMLGRWVSFWDCLFLGAMLNFRDVASWFFEKKPFVCVSMASTRVPWEGMDIEDWWLQVSLAYPFGHHQPLTLGGEVIVKWCFVKFFFFGSEYLGIGICKLVNKPVMGIGIWYVIT